MKARLRRSPSSPLRPAPRGLIPEPPDERVVRQQSRGLLHTPNVTWSFALGGTALVFTSPTPGSEVLSQCVGVEGGSLYTVSAAVNQGGDGGVALHVRWFDAAGCGGTVLGASPSLDFEPPASLFEPKSRVLASPGAAHSALVLFVMRADTLSGFPFVVDDVVFASEPFGEILTLPTAASAPRRARPAVRDRPLGAEHRRRRPPVLAADCVPHLR